MYSKFIRRCGIQDLLVEEKKERELSKITPRHLTCSKGLTLVPFIETGYKEKTRLEYGRASYSSVAVFSEAVCNVSRG